MKHRRRKDRPPSLLFGVVYSRSINFLSFLILCAAGLFLFLMVASPALKRYSMDMIPVNILRFKLLVAGCVSALGWIPALILLKINHDLKKLRPSGREYQIMISGLGLLLFPVGTVLYGISLYYMAFDKATRKAFAV